MLELSTCLGDKLKILRNKLGLTQQQLSEKLNVSVLTIGMYEQGRREPDLSIIIEMSNIFHTSVPELLGIEEKFHTKSIHIEKIILELIDFIQSQDYVFFKGKKLSRSEINSVLYVLKLVLK